jgi:exoribonuclease-2
VADCGLAESRELVHQALVTTGIWKPYENLWPARAGCVLYPSRVDIDIGLVRGDEIPRIDLTYLRSYAIDNAWSNDPDDAVSIEGDHVWVHVADPAAFFGPGSEVDAEALRRGATLYLPEIIVPMLPSAMMDRLGLGLNPSSEALSFKIRLDEAGGIVSTEIMPSTLQVTRLYYSRADELLQSGDADLAGLQACAAKRRQRRILNGAVEIDFPEVSMKAEAGEVRCVPVPETTSSGIVQEMMLLAGEAAARWAWERKLPFTYSSQEAPQLPRDFPLSDTGEKFLSTQYQRRKGMRASIVDSASPSTPKSRVLYAVIRIFSPITNCVRPCFKIGQGDACRRTKYRDSASLRARGHPPPGRRNGIPGFTGSPTTCPLIRVGPERRR